jgi:hypothetical protein
MATLTEVREGVATLLSTIPGLQSSARILSNPSLPTAYVLPGETNFHQTFGDGPSDYNLIVELQVGTYSDIGAQMKLDEFLAETGEASIKAAIETDPTLGGLVDDLIVQGFRDYGLFQRAQGDAVLGARVLVWVLN